MSENLPVQLEQQRWGISFELDIAVEVNPVKVVRLPRNPAA
jgi:hypothetical protein